MADISRRDFFARLGLGIAGAVLSSPARAQRISIEDILDAMLGAKADKEWMPFVDCKFQGPEFDSQGVFSYFERQGNAATREDFRSGASAYTESNGVLTMSGDSQTYDVFGTDKRKGSQRISAYFDSDSLATGEGLVIIRLTDGNLGSENSMYVSVFNTAYDGFTIHAVMSVNGAAYSLFEPIQYSGEALRLTKDDSGVTFVELGLDNVWYPIVGSDALAGVECRALIIPAFYNDSWKPKMTGLTIEEFRLPCDANGDGRVDAVDLQLAINKVLGRDTSPYNPDVNGDGICDSLDIQEVINFLLRYK